MLIFGKVMTPGVANHDLAPCPAVSLARATSGATFSPQNWGDTALQHKTILSFNERLNGWLSWTRIEINCGAAERFEQTKVHPVWFNRPRHILSVTPVREQASLVLKKVFLGARAFVYRSQAVSVHTVDEPNL